MARGSLGEVSPTGEGLGGTLNKNWSCPAPISLRRDCETDFRSELEALRTERPELHFLISGPWPPYTFANIDLEFETQFGVS